MEGSATATKGLAATAAAHRARSGPQGDCASAGKPSNRSCGVSDSDSSPGAPTAASSPNSGEVSEKGSYASGQAEKAACCCGSKDDACVPSRLDIFDPNSELARSPYRGFAMLICA